MISSCNFLNNSYGFYIDLTSAINFRASSFLLDTPLLTISSILYKAGIATKPLFLLSYTQFPCIADLRPPIKPSINSIHVSTIAF